MSSELSVHDKSIFYDEDGNIIPHLYHEREEQLDVYMFLNRDSTVLELGARNGTVSCLINRILINKENHVAVDPDKSVINSLIKNRDDQGCKFHVFNGAVSKQPLKFKAAYGIERYGSSTVIVNNEKEVDVISMSMQELEEKYSIKFDVLVADCEGCMCQFVQENNMSQFKMILLEKDQCHTCNYDIVENYLSNLGFLRIRNELNIVFRSVYINMNFLPFKILSYKVSRGTIGVFGKLGYISEENVNVGIDQSHTLSAHAPSKVLIEAKKFFQIQGYCSLTAEECPELTFKCDGNIVGIINEPGKKTACYEIQPGKHELTVGTDDLSWSHSVWIFNEI
jgi:FkbM family methyltransferase